MTSILYEIYINSFLIDFTFNYQHGFRSNPIEENSKNDDADRFGTQGWKFRRKVDQDDFDTDSFETTTEVKRNIVNILSI